MTGMDALLCAIASSECAAQNDRAYSPELPSDRKVMAKVLVIDDNDDERQIYSAVLHYNGFDVEEASNALAGIDLAKAVRPAAIVMDVRMPGLNGLLATEILRATPETSRIPVVCVSGYDVPPDQAKAAGCNRMLRKPVPPTELVIAVQAVVDPQIMS